MIEQMRSHYTSLDHVDKKGALTYAITSDYSQI